MQHPLTNVGFHFLIKVLERKVEVLLSRYKKNQYEFEKNSVVVISSIYGIDILEDNVEETQNRLFNYYKSVYSKTFKGLENEELLLTLKFILSKNIIHGDALSLKKVDWATNDDVKLSNEWNRNMSFGLIAALKHPRAVHIVKYENLIKHAEISVEKIMEFVGLKIEKMQLLPSDSDNLISPGEHSWKSNINKALMLDRINAWKKELPMDSINTLTKRMNYYLKHFDYLEKPMNYNTNLPTVVSSQHFMVFISMKLYKFKHWFYARFLNRVPR